MCDRFFDMTNAMTMTQPRSMTHTNSSGKRTIDAHECARCEPCASGPSKTPKLGRCESTEDEEEEVIAFDTADADPAPNGSRICVTESCGKWSNWGPINGEKNSARFCAPHGRAYGGCENVVSKRCAEPTCKILCPAFGPVGGVRKDATHCSDHGKLQGYANLVSPRCQHDGCEKHATFGEHGGKIIRCSKHHDPAVHIDLVHAICNQTGCNKQASCGLTGTKPIRCGYHRGDYVDLVNKLCQHADGCPRYPSYGVKGGRPTFCAKHSDKEKHEDVRTMRCVTCTLTPKKFRHPDSNTGQCNECDPAIYTMPRKKKEEATKAVLEAAFPTHFIHPEMHVDFCGEGADRTACGKNQSLRARCDFVLETVLADGDGAVVQVEVDEDAHRYNCQADEIIRAQSIVAALHEGRNHRHVHVVRFNPDAFKVDDQTERVPLNVRYAKLVEIVKAALASNKPKDTWSLQYMYYDCDTDGEDRRLCIMNEIHPHIRDIVLRPIID